MKRLVPLFLAAACTPAVTTPAPAPTPTVTVTAADRARIRVFDATTGPTLLAQCSRDAPRATGFFRPAIEQVLAAEPAIFAALAGRHPELARGLPALRRGWRVEAVGLVQGGRRSLYLNYAPVGPYDHERGGLPTIVCDGGPAFFGVQVDPASGAVLHLDFNGMA